MRILEHVRRQHHYSEPLLRGIAAQELRLQLTLCDDLCNAARLWLRRLCLLSIRRHNIGSHLVELTCWQCALHHGETTVPSVHQRQLPLHDSTHLQLHGGRRSRSELSRRGIKLRLL